MRHKSWGIFRPIGSRAGRTHCACTPSSPARRPSSTTPRPAPACSYWRRRACQCEKATVCCGPASSPKNHAVHLRPMHAAHTLRRSCGSACERLTLRGERLSKLASRNLWGGRARPAAAISDAGGGIWRRWTGGARRNSSRAVHRAPRRGGLGNVDCDLRGDAAI